MGTVSRDNHYIAGLALLRQDYLATVLELVSADGITKQQLDLLLVDLAEEHRLHCMQEWRAISTQVKVDQEVHARLSGAR
jgi:hypothetical protein